MVETKPSYRFDETTYEELCDLSKKGNLVQLEKLINQEDKSSFGRLTFCPESPRKSPLVLAAQQGHLNVVLYFLDNFADIIDINYEMSIVRAQKDDKNVHDATGLFAAILGSHNDVVKFLISRGADVCKASRSGCTPLHIASELGNVNVLNFLIMNGADINQLNLLGRNALWIAAGENRLEAMEFLLESGASSVQVDIIGYTAMHIAADKGHGPIITALFKSGVSPLFAVANPRDKDYVPCPLFLAAANNHTLAVDLFINRDDCPKACKSDAILLLAMHSIFKRGLDLLKANIEFGLRLREESNVTVIYPEPHKVFGYRQEIKNREELRALWGTPEFMTESLYYQCLLVEERCIGIKSTITIAFKSYFKIAAIFITAKKYPEGEALTVNALESIISHCERLLLYLQQDFFEEMLNALARLHFWVIRSIVRLINEGYLPQFDRHIDCLNRALYIYAVQSSVKIPSWKFVTCGLRLFSLWLSSIESETDKSRKNERVIECRALGEKFVANHLYIDQTTLLHLELVRVDLALTDLKILSSHLQDILLIDSLLKWGADEAINMMDNFGRRPIHSVKGRLLFELFVSYGAHPDAVNSFGGSAYDALNFNSDCSVPLSLACYAARKIVAEKFPYLFLDLPSSIKDFIQLHDKDHAPPMLERGRYHLM